MPQRRKQKPPERPSIQSSPVVRSTKQNPNPTAKSQPKNRKTEASRTNTQDFTKNIPSRAAAKSSAEDQSAEETAITYRRSARLLDRANLRSAIPYGSTSVKEQQKAPTLKRETKSKTLRTYQKASPKRTQDKRPTVFPVAKPIDTHALQQDSASTQINIPVQSIEEASEEVLQATSKSTESCDSDTEEPFFVPYCNAEQLALIEAIVLDQKLGVLIMNANKRLGERLPDLRNINVEPEGTPDSYIDVIRNMDSALPLKPKESADHLKIFDDWWNIDRKRCINNNEALFQRTLMVQMIDRHRLFFHKKLFDEKKGVDLRCCDFSVEQRWVCPSMPSREGATAPLPFPSAQPDLCVSFLASKVLRKKNKAHLPPALKELIFFEGVEGSSRNKVFPFIMIEAKNGYSSPDSEPAFFQCLNYASQALHMMYEFMRETNKQNDTGEPNYIQTEHEKNFFEKVRVFTVVATASGVRIRIHRAVEIVVSPSTSATTRQQDTKIPLLYQSDYRKVVKLDRITKTYPLQFEHDDYKTFNNQDFYHRDVVREFEKIIWGYGHELANLLMEASDEVASKFKANPELIDEHDHEFYRHGQRPKFYKAKTSTPSPAPGKVTRSKSNAASRVASPLNQVQTQEPSTNSGAVHVDASEPLLSREDGINTETGPLSQDSLASDATLIRKADDLGLDGVLLGRSGPSTKRTRSSLD